MLRGNQEILDLVKAQGFSAYGICQIIIFV